MKWKIPQNNFIIFVLELADVVDKKIFIFTKGNKSTIILERSQNGRTKLERVLNKMNSRFEEEVHVDH